MRHSLSFIIYLYIVNYIKLEGPKPDSQRKMTSNVPIDVEKAIELLGGHEKIFYQMLKRLEDLSLIPALE